MSAVVIQLFGKTKPAAVSLADQENPSYFCLRCAADDFKLYATGLVHCSKCGALIRNLSVYDRDRPSA